jgi:hypothetical protein
VGFLDRVSKLQFYIWQPTIAPTVSLFFVGGGFVIGGVALLMSGTTQSPVKRHYGDWHFGGNLLRLHPIHRKRRSCA